MNNISGTGKEFMEKTRYKYLDRSDQQKGLPQPPLQIPPTKERMHKLPDPKNIDKPKVDLIKAIEERISHRVYSEQYLTQDELSLLLWCTQGVKKLLPRNATQRTVPSAGARHCFETYLLVNRVEELDPGLYRYIALSHELQEVELSDDLGEKITQACFNQRFVKESAVTFIWTAVAYRMMWRYGERGYRYMHLDVGHVCQNLYLAAEAVNSGVCAIGAFNDEVLNNVIGVDGVNQFVIYVATCGKKR